MVRRFLFLAAILFSSLLSACFLSKTEAHAQSCDLKISASLGGCDNVFVGWFTTRRDVTMQTLAYGDGFSPPISPADRSYSRTGVGCSYTTAVTVTQRYANGQTCSASYGNNHNRPCDQCGATIAPAIIVNAANYRGSVTADSIAAAFAEGITTGNAAAAALPLPKSLAGVTVWFDGEQCEIFAVAPNQVNFRIPASATAGLRPVRISNGSGKSFFGDVFVSGQAPGVFTRDGSGGGPAAAAYLSFGAATFAVLFVTGVNPDTITAADVVLADGRGGRYTAGWIGRAPGLVGLVQVNVPIPASAIDGRGASLRVAAWESQGFTLAR